MTGEEGDIFLVGVNEDTENAALAFFFFFFLQFVIM